MKIAYARHKKPLGAIGAVLLVSLLSAWFLPGSARAADDSTCARVKIEIKQELTLERQAFDAEMRITNGLSSISLEDVGVTVNFLDDQRRPVLASSNPADTSALFFLRLSSMENVSDVSGSGTVAAATTADIHWLIIPTTGASKGATQGTLYYVGATLTYTIGGEEHLTEVTPDYIYVKPLPRIALDYFLPVDVYGDDGFTTEIEPPVPFNLGVRVSNNGQGVAKNLKISSAQPKIVDNQQGLLIGFVIEESEVNGNPVPSSLLANFGDIAPNASAVARWIMTCSLSGRFIEFKADYTHSDELGGELTSLLEDPVTHFLVRDVLVDLPGRDRIRDFLAIDGAGSYTLYESEKIDTPVFNQSASSTLSGSGNQYTLSTPVTAGFVVVKLSDPNGGQKTIKEVIRSDGKRIKPENAWLAKTRVGSQPWEHFFYLFDANTTGSYTVNFEEPAVAHAPVLEFVPDRIGLEGQTLSFVVQASDPDGTIPKLSAAPLPAGASFTEQGNGIGAFVWTPAVGQAGRYEITFAASDGALEAKNRAALTIRSLSDTDGDGMLDSWELSYFNTLDRDGQGDFDGDGLSDLDEFLQGKDPTKSNAPSTPEIFSPEDMTEVAVLQPQLVVTDSADPDGDPVTYGYELYSDEAMSVLVASQSGVSETLQTTSWPVPQELVENTWYFWRVRATDGCGFSQWAYGSFFVNTQNDPPGPFNISSPANQAEVTTTTPALEVTNSTDADEDVLTYSFEIYEDSSMAGPPIASVPGVQQGGNGSTSWTVNTPLNDNTWYYWRAKATDEHGATSETAVASFFVNTANDAPQTPTVLYPADGAEVAVQELDLMINNAADVDGDTLSYFLELDKVNTFGSEAKISSGSVTEGWTTTAWRVSGLEENTWYYWRAKASDGAAESSWVTAAFFVNTENDPPSMPTVRNPGNGAWVSTVTPTLELNISIDLDNDAIIYRFELYEDSGLHTLLASHETDVPSWLVGMALSDNTWYFWRAQAQDQHGATSEWTERASFFTDSNGVDDAPVISLEEPAHPVTLRDGVVFIRWEDADPDSSALITLYYESATTGRVLIAGNIEEDPDGDADTYLWNLSGLPEGTYTVYAEIADGSNTRSSSAPGLITIDRTPPAVQASLEPGTYTSSQSVTLIASEPGNIYYTLDGSEPTTQSSLYTSPIDITRTTSLKVMAEDHAGNQSEVFTATYVVQSNLFVNVKTSKDRALSGLKVYAFTAAGAYTGVNATTDAQGSALFNPQAFSAGVYKFRADYLGSQFWSQAVRLPENTLVDLVIEEETTEVSVAEGTGSASGVQVYLFSASGAYLGLNATADGQGRVLFDLPVGKTFKFRADILGSKYWSQPVTVSGGAVNQVSLDAGGGLIVATVEKSAESPMDGIRVYLYKASGAYVGLSLVTNASGQASFSVPEGIYQIRADYLGYQFWSADYSVTEDTVITLPIPHEQVEITVQAMYQDAAEPIPNIPVYLYTAAGSYVGRRVTTNAAGKVFFELPHESYKVRADYLGRQYWSEGFTWLDNVIEVPLGDAEITVSGGGFPREGVNVYVFSQSRAYLGLNQATNAEGKVLFRLPEASYKFRVDYQGSQYWSQEESLTAGQMNQVLVSVGGGTFSVSVVKGSGEPRVGVNCYVYSDANQYLGLFGATDSDGQVFFDLAAGSYKFRADLFGYHFWSGVVPVPTSSPVEIVIDEETVEVEVSTRSGPKPGVRVYLFSGSEAYLGLYKETDGEGKVFFDLPVGKSFRFRADILGSRYWSEPVVIAGGAANHVSLNAGGGLFEVRLEKAEGVPLQGVKVYLYGSSGSYLGLSQATEASAAVMFDVPEGTYSVRADYLGYQFWSEDFYVDHSMSVALSIPHRSVEVTVQGVYQGAGAALGGIPVYLYTAAGSYVVQNLVTNAEGKVLFELPDQLYKVRLDYLGQQVWSQEFIQNNVSVDIPMADAEVTVTGAGFPRDDVAVYVFSLSGSYLGVHDRTNSGGTVTFRLPEGDYLFRADYQTGQFWSSPETLTAHQVNPVIVSVGGGTFTFSVLKSPSEPLFGARTYAFTGGGCDLGMFGATDTDGMVYFDLADGRYKFRVDHMGYQFWSDVFDVPSVFSGSLDISHTDVTVTVQGLFLEPEPLEGLKVYLFNPSGSYLGKNRTTDAQGRVTFSLPAEPYRVRVDFLGRQYWSDPFTASDTTVTIPRGLAQVRVTRSGADVAGAKVYLFSEGGSYLGWYRIIDSAGIGEFIIPSGFYKFRVDEGGHQYWTPVTDITAGEANLLEVGVD
jgi:hypothetical protein